MKRHGVRLITAALATAVAAACFSDPTSSLRNGPASVVLSRSAAIVPIGDSTLVEARVVDQQGNVLPATGAAWTTDNAAVAEVAVAASQVPADGGSRAYIKGIATLGGITDVRVTVRGLTASVRVTALPTRYFGTGTFAVTGTATADTTPLGAAFTAGDTITITAPAGMTFDAAASVITLGGTGTYTLSRSATAVKALVIKGYSGQATVTNVTWLGNATTGDYSIESLNTTDEVTVARGRFRGGAAVSTGALGTNTLLTLTAQTGTTFTDTTGVEFGTTTGLVLSRTATTVTAISPVTTTDNVKVTNVNIGTVLVDSLFTPGQLTVAVSDFKGTIAPATTTVGVEIVATAPAGLSFDPAVGVQVNGADVIFTAKTSSEVRFIAPTATGGTVTLSGLVLPGAMDLLTLDASTSITVTDPSEPGNDAPAGGAAITLPAATGDSVVVYGSTGGSDVDDFFTITTATGDSLEISVEWPNGDIDIDAFVLDATGGGFCDLDGCSAATGADPEVRRVRLAAATSYEIYINLWDDHDEVTPVPYRITITKKG